MSKNINEQIATFEDSAIHYGFDDTSRDMLRQNRRDKAIEDARVVRTGRRALALIAATGLIAAGAAHNQIGSEINTVLNDNNNNPALNADAHMGERTAQQNELANAINTHQETSGSGQ